MTEYAKPAGKINGAERLFLCTQCDEWTLMEFNPRRRYCSHECKLAAHRERYHSRDGASRARRKKLRRSERERKLAGVPVRARRGGDPIRSDEEWEDREALIEDSLHLGLNAYDIARDCGVVVDSLLRQCRRRGRDDLAERLLRARPRMDQRLDRDDWGRFLPIYRDVA